MKRRIWTIVAASGASFLLGTQFSQLNWNLSDYKQFPFIIANADSVLVAQPEQLPDDYKGPDIAAQKRTIRNEVDEFWKQPSRASQIMKFGYPGYDNLRTYEDFVLSYDRRTRTAHWVVEHLTPDRLVYDASMDRSKSAFKPDTSIHTYFQSQNSDYFRSGYDRGHLAAAGNHRRSQNSIDQTFFLTNMSPQVGKGFNRDKWNDVEKHVRRLARKNLNVYIATGPLYLPRLKNDGNLYVKYKVIGQNRVAVPTHFFKVALIETEKDKFELEAYLLPNQAISNEKPISDFLVPLDSIERAAGFLLFQDLPKEKLNKINGQRVGGGGLAGLLRNFLCI